MVKSKEFMEELSNLLVQKLKPVIVNAVKDGIALEKVEEIHVFDRESKLPQIEAQNQNLSIELKSDNEFDEIINFLKVFHTNRFNNVILTEKETEMFVRWRFSSPSHKQIQLREKLKANAHRQDIRFLFAVLNHIHGFKKYYTNSSRIFAKIICSSFEGFKNTDKRIETVYRNFQHKPTKFYPFHTEKELKEFGIVNYKFPRK